MPVSPDQVLQARLENRYLTGIQAVDLGFVDIEADYVVSKVGKTRPGHQTHVTCPDNANSTHVRFAARLYLLTVRAREQVLNNLRLNYPFSFGCDGFAGVVRRLLDIFSTSPASTAACAATRPFARALASDRPWPISTCPLSPRSGAPPHSA